MSLLRQSESIRILTVDDHQLLREGIAAVLESQEDMTLVAQDSNGAPSEDIGEQLLLAHAARVARGEEVVS